MSGNDSLAAKRALVPQRSPQPPRFIAIEGPLRVGKTTLARILAERLHARLRAFLFPLLRLGPPGNQHLGDRFRRAQRRLAAASQAAPGSGQRYAILPAARRLRIETR